MHTIARAVLLALALFAVATAGAQDSRPGVQVQGAPGVTRTTQDIMTAQANAPAIEAVAEMRPAPRVHFARRPNPNELPDPPAAHAPEVASGMGPKLAQVSPSNFLGAKTSDSGYKKPRTMGAIGPSQFVVAVNGRIRSFDRATAAPDGILDVTTDIFFASALTPVGGAVALNLGASEPRIRFDRGSQRWFVVMIDLPCADANCNSLKPNRVMIAVSDTAAIQSTTRWTFFWFTPAGGHFYDYPTLGIDNNALYIGANVWDLAYTSPINTDAYVVQKSSLLGAGPMVVTAFQNLFVPGPCVNPGDDGPWTPQGVDNPNPATEGYFIGVSGCVNGELVMRRVSNPGTASPTISGNIAINVPHFEDVDWQPHLGNTRGPTGNLNVIDTRLVSAQVRNGLLYAAHTIAVDSTGAGVPVGPGSRNGIRWYQLNNLAGTPGVAQSGTVFDPAVSNPQRWFSYPGIQVNGQGHMAIGFTTSGPAQRINAGFTGRLASDPPGQTDPVQVYTNTTAAYNLGQPSPNGIPWGDVSFTSVDPNDDQTMWTIQEYAEATDSWGVRVARLQAPPPATPASYSVSSIPAGTPSTTFTLTGTSTNGSGFFDPGGSVSAWTNHIKVEIVGGAPVTVTGVTVVDPTHLTVTVSTVGASPGTKLVRVTNPDGQFAQDNGDIFTVTGNVAPIFASPNSLICTVGSACNFTFLTQAGAPASTFSIAGALPSGVTFATPSLSGTPAAGTQGTYTITVTAANGNAPNATQIFTLIVTAPCGGFTDVTTGDSFCNASEWLKNRGITLGCTATQYCPTQNVTRAQMALFMQRLGDAIAPHAYADNVLPFGFLAIDQRPSFCTTAAFPAANFPRVAQITWSFVGFANSPLAARVWTQTSFDNGGTYTSNESTLQRVSALGNGYVGTSATVRIGVPAGASPQFRFRTDRVAGNLGSGNFTTGSCNFGILFLSVNGGGSPYDPPAAAREEP